MFRDIALIGIVATLVAVLGHRLIFGAIKVGPGERKRTVRRFSVWERLFHVVTVTAFWVLAATGFADVIEGEPLHGLLWVLHMAVAPLFVIGLTAVLMTWARDGRFAAYDWKWAKVCGGYLRFGAHPPAGRFNAGQKVYFWAAGLLGLSALLTGLGRVYPVFGPLGQEILYQTHRWTALVFVLFAFVHLYLGTLANPGTFLAVILGRVSPAWAETHHPVWWKEIQECAETEGKQSKG